MPRIDLRIRVNHTTGLIMMHEWTIATDWSGAESEPGLQIDHEIRVHSSTHLNESHSDMKHSLICSYCHETVLPGESHQVTNDGNLVLHFECFTRLVVGSVTHQLQKCTCYGCDQGDPPEWTRRQAAKAASELYHTGCYENPNHQSTLFSVSVFKPSLNWRWSLGGDHGTVRLPWPDHCREVVWSFLLFWRLLILKHVGSGRCYGELVWTSWHRTSGLGAGYVLG